MKRILPYAAGLFSTDPAWNVSLNQLSNLKALVLKMKIQAQRHVAPDGFNSSYDFVAHAWAQPLGSGTDDSAIDGLLPCLAPESASSNLSNSVPIAQHSTHHAACFTPVHALVATDGINFSDPCSIPFSSDDARVLFQAIAPTFESEGVELTYISPWNWQVAHPSLAGVPLPSLGRVLGQSVQHWQSSNPLQPLRLLRRLQSEAQMILHTHPLNQAREAQGLPCINSLWLGPVKVAECVGYEVDWRLREPYLQGDAQAWAQAWQAIDASLAPMRAILHQLHPPVIELAFAHSTGYCIWSTANQAHKGWLQSWSSFISLWRQRPADVQSLLHHS